MSALQESLHWVLNYKTHSSRNKLLVEAWDTKGGKQTGVSFSSTCGDVLFEKNKMRWACCSFIFQDSVMLCELKVDTW